MNAVPSTAPNGGAWCLERPAGNTQGCFPGLAYQKLPGISDGALFSLSGWCRIATQPWQPAVGIAIGALSSGNMITMGTAATTVDTAWTFVSVTDTFHLNVGDTAIVILDAGMVGGPAWSLAQFDNITLVPATGIGEQVHATMRIHPVPARDMLYVSLSPVGQRYSIRTATGELVMNGAMTTTALSVSELAAGLYFLHVEGARPARFIKH